MSACVVFGIAKLLEEILVRLSFQEALRAIRINKTFRDTIKLFPKLQRKLFFPQTSGAAADQAAKPSVNPILRDMLHYCSKDAHLSVREVLEPRSDDGRDRSASPDYRDSFIRRKEEESINDIAYQQGRKYYMWLDIGIKYRYECMEELVKCMRAERQTWHEMYASNRACEMFVTFGGWGGTYRFPADIKMVELLRRVVKRYRYRLRFGGPDSKKRAQKVAARWSDARGRPRREERPKTQNRAAWNLQNASAHGSIYTTSTAQPSIMRASESVFAIPELFEAILLHVPPKHLLASAQRVSRSWLEHIDTSSQLQRKLFFKQHPETNRNVVPTKNPFFVKICYPVVGLAVCEFVLEKPHTDSTGRMAIIADYILRCMLYHHPYCKEVAGLEHPQSWHRMYVTDMPCAILVSVGDQSIIYNRKRTATLTLGEMMATAVKMYRRRSEAGSA